MGTYSGVVVCDALKTHEAGARGNDRISLAGCWAHVFRKFEEAAPDHPAANLAMKWIGELYAIDEEAGGDLCKLAELRETKSVEVLALMKTWLWNQAPLKTLSIGNAAAYVIANSDRLSRFVSDPRIPLDNNATERGIRGPVVGRRNHFGSKSERGTEVAAVFYSLLETAKLCGVARLGTSAKLRSPTHAANCSCLTISSSGTRLSPRRPCLPHAPRRARAPSLRGARRRDGAAREVTKE
jgi:transposase